ncbi:MAG: YfiR family protein [Desulfobulbaceae bacterium]|nr:MAG: YfiR family protein [Desulfobulbaceae bacterium]
MATPSLICLGLRRMCAALLTIILLLTCCCASPCVAKQIEEYHVKAVFLFNLVHFVTWPAEPSAADLSPFSIGIYGEDPFGQVLDNVIKGEKKFDTLIVVKRYGNLEELRTDPCNILFVSAKAMSQWAQIRALIAASAILSVSDVAGFPENGGMVNLLKSDQRVQIEINRTAVDEAGLAVSAKLLTVARLVPRKL